MEQKQNINEIAAHLSTSFQRVMIGQVDEYCAFLVRIEGAYLFHEHPKDEMYLVLDGELALDYDGGRTVVLNRGDTLVAKAGELHRSRSEKGALVLIFKAMDILSDEKRSVERRITCTGREER